jgi:hypothetical protein
MGPVGIAVVVDHEILPEAGARMGRGALTITPARRATGSK